MADGALGMEGLTIPRICQSCAFARGPTGLNLPAVSLTSAEQQKALAARRAELRARQVMEQSVVRQKSASELKFRPIDHFWCEARSSPEFGRYYFCEWQRDDTCEYYSGREADSRHASPAPSQSSTGVPPRADGASAPLEPGPEKPGDWLVELGAKLSVEPVLRHSGSDLELDYQLMETDAEPFFLSGEGLKQTMLVFGGPGAGKTYFYKYLIEQVLSLRPPPGLLLLDPKGALVEWIKTACRQAGRERDLLLITNPAHAKAAEASPRAFNVLGNFLPTGALGRLISDVVLAESPEVDPGWAVLLIDLLQSACTIIAHDEGVVTAASLFEETLFQQAYRSPKTGERMSLYPIQARARALMARAQPGQRLPKDVERACVRLQDYYTSTEDKQRRFIRQIVESALGDLVSETWGHLSDADSKSDPYEEIIRDGAIVAVCLGQEAPAFQRSLSTLMKALFQQRVLLTIGSEKHPATERLTVLACDEYAQVVTEGSSGLVSDARFFSLAREAGCLNLLALQSIATARSRFPQQMRDRWEGILGNVGIRFFMGLNDIETAELGSSLAGDRDRAVRMVTSTQSSTGTSVGDTNNMIKARVVPPWFLTNRMPTGLVLVQGKLDGRSAPVLGLFRVVRRNQPSNVRTAPPGNA